MVRIYRDSNDVRRQAGASRRYAAPQHEPTREDKMNPGEVSSVYFGHRCKTFVRMRTGGS